MQLMNHIFKTLGLPEKPIILAPLAGVSDIPFRRVCQMLGADLTYVEMISATALCYDSPRTLEMLARHRDEKILGVQITSRNPEEMAQGIAKLNNYSFETIDINMGCPVKKVVKSGCGSAILKDPERVYATTLAAVQNTDKPVSVKIRLGWDHDSLTYKEVVRAATEAGAKWLTVHGRTRSDSYSDPVDLDKMYEIKTITDIPVIGNGNLFTSRDADVMSQKCHSDGLMVSRGALGNPWIFSQMKGLLKEPTLDEWYDILSKHVALQKELYRSSAMGSVCMRKHILWYIKGWPNARMIRDQITSIGDLDDVQYLLEKYVEKLRKDGISKRDSVSLSETSEIRFKWDPKYDMDRSLDRGVGHEGLDC